MNKWEKKFEEYLKKQFQLIGLFETDHSRDYGYICSLGDWDCLPCVRINEGNLVKRKTTSCLFNIINKYGVEWVRGKIVIKQYDDSNQSQCVWSNFHSFRIRTQKDYEHYCERSLELIKSVKDMRNKYKLMLMEKDFV